MDRDNLAEDVTALMQASGGVGYDIVVDATGATAVTEATVGLARTVAPSCSMASWVRTTLSVSAPTTPSAGEITIKGSFAEISSFPATIEALRSGRVRTDGLITHRFAINDYAAALQALRTDRTAHKIVITI